MPAGPTAPSRPIGTGTAAATGTWVGTATDSSGTTMGMSTGSMGMGMPGGSMGNMTWQLTQTGTTFTLFLPRDEQRIRLLKAHRASSQTHAKDQNGKETRTADR